VLAGLRGDLFGEGGRRDHAISETLYCDWRENLLECGREALAVRMNDSVSGSCGAGMPGWSGRSGARRASWSSHDSCGSGSETDTSPALVISLPKVTLLRWWRVSPGSALRRSTEYRTRIAAAQAAERSGRGPRSWNT
jgi:hypothetical protein